MNHSFDYNNDMGLLKNEVYMEFNIQENLDKNNYVIYNYDAYKFAKELKKENIVVNHIITDPPYNISKENNFSTLRDRKGIDFGEWDKGFDLLNILERP